MPGVVRGTVRRAPRYAAFIVVGGIVGLLVALVLVLTAPGSGGLGLVLAFVGGGCALLGALLGGVAAVLADRRSVRSRTGRDRPADGGRPGQ